MVLPPRSLAFKPEGLGPGKIVDTVRVNAGNMCFVPRGLVHDAIAADAISRHITTGLLARREDLNYKWRARSMKEAGDQVVPECYGMDIAFPGHCAAPLRAALSRARFEVGTLARDLGAEGHAVPACGLVRERALSAL